MKNNICHSCGGVLKNRYQIKYCSNRCQGVQKRKLSIEQWKSGIRDGTVGVKTRIISVFLRDYLFEKYHYKCSQCGWNKKHSITGKVPLEIDHIDGNAENNTESNLRVLCPNCHSLTPYFRNLNKGNGRTWRTKKL